jgi:hypothetical protein
MKKYRKVDNFSKPSLFLPQVSQASNQTLKSPTLSRLTTQASESKNFAATANRLLR